MRTVPFQGRRHFLGALASAVPAAATTAVQAKQPEDDGGQIPVGPEERSLGPADAPATIIEYASLTCPHCASFHSETWPEIREGYVESGMARFVLRDFPLDRLALAAAMLARCVSESRYFMFIDLLLSRQTEWAKAEDPLAALTELAGMVGLNKEAGSSCLEDEALAKRVLSTRREGKERFQISSTPTFLIYTRRKITGNQALEAFAEILDPVADKA